MDFDDAISHRRSALIDVPYVPDLCTDATGPLDTINDFILMLEEELTYRQYLEIAVESCCDDLLEWTLAGQDTAEDILVEVGDSLDVLYNALWIMNSMPGQLNEFRA
jgi:hypothetical protein